MQNSRFVVFNFFIFHKISETNIDSNYRKKFWEKFVILGFYAEPYILQKNKKSLKLFFFFWAYLSDDWNSKRKTKEIQRKKKWLWHSSEIFLFFSEHIHLITEIQTEKQKKFKRKEKWLWHSSKKNNAWLFFFFWAYLTDDSWLKFKEKNKRNSKKKMTLTFSRKKNMLVFKEFSCQMNMWRKLFLFLTYMCLNHENSFFF